MQKYNIKVTDGQDHDFIDLCRLLDFNLDEIVGETFQREKYQQYNTLDDIHDVIMIYQDRLPVACGGFKYYDDLTAEIKRVFVKKELRRHGLAKILMRELENRAIEKGFSRLILETGEPLKASMGLYRSIGFTIIANYGQYREMKESICMEKILA